MHISAIFGTIHLNCQQYLILKIFCYLIKIIRLILILRRHRFSTVVSSSKISLVNLQVCLVIMSRASKTIERKRGMTSLKLVDFVKDLFLYYNIYNIFLVLLIYVYRIDFIVIFKTIIAFSKN